VFIFFPSCCIGLVGVSTVVGTSKIVFSLVQLVNKKEAKMAMIKKKEDNFIG